MSATMHALQASMLSPSKAYHNLCVNSVSYYRKEDYLDQDHSIFKCQWGNKAWSSLLLLLTFNIRQLFIEHLLHVRLKKGAGPSSP